MWRFREFVLPSAVEVVSHPEGNTPLLHREALDRWSGIGGLLLKHEGHNPTGSFKDRGMTVGVTQAVRIGARAVACASTGNTSASLAAYAAQAGIPALVLVPAGKVAAGKLAQSLAYGARTLLVRGGFDDCLRLVQEASERLGVYLLNSINPFRIEGQKTIVLEMLEQLGWDPPDWIVLPAGNLGNTAAFGKALREALAWGLIDRVPRIAAVQAEGAAPFARSFEEGFARRHRVEPETVATRHSDRRSRLPRPGGADHPGDGRGGARGDRRADPRGEGGGGRVGRRVRAGQRGERGGRARAVAPGDHRARRTRGGGAHRARAQGPRHAADYHLESSSAAARRQPPGGDRGRFEGRGAGAEGAQRPNERDRRSPSVFPLAFSSRSFDSRPEGKS